MVKWIAIVCSAHQHKQEEHPLCFGQLLLPHSNQRQLPVLAPVVTQLIGLELLNEITRELVKKKKKKTHWYSSPVLDQMKSEPQEGGAEKIYF